jgi:transposase
LLFWFFIIIFLFGKGSFFCFFTFLKEGKMLFVRPLTAKEEEEVLQRIKAATKTRIYLRLKTVELSFQGKRVQEIAGLLSRHPNSIRSYIHRFNQGGFSELMPRWGGGASQKLGAWDKAWWEDLLSRPPCQFGKLATQSQRWTYPLLQEYLLCYEGRKVHPNTIWLHLRRVKFTSGRAKLSVTSPDPDYQVKRDRVERLEKKPSRGA